MRALVGHVNFSVLLAFLADALTNGVRGDVK